MDETCSEKTPSSRHLNKEREQNHSNPETPLKTPSETYILRGGCRRGDHLRKKARRERLRVYERLKFTVRFSVSLQ